MLRHNGVTPATLCNAPSSPHLRRTAGSTMKQHRSDPVVRAAPWLVAALVVAITAWVVRIETRRDEPRVTETLSHVHALVPAGDALWIATHRGLFVARRDAEPVRVGEGARDLMGLAITSDDVFLASGHPDMAGRRADEPNNVGLIESRDGGRTWAALGLEGEADLHEIVTAGDELLAWDATTGTLLASRDGRSWAARSKLDLSDLAHDDVSDTLVATGRHGVQISLDRARTWSRAQTEPLVALAVDDGVWWAVDEAGAIWSSTGATSWARIDDGMPGATAIARSGRTTWLAVERVDGTAILLTEDDGRTWTSVTPARPTDAS